MLPSTHPPIRCKRKKPFGIPNIPSFVIRHGYCCHRHLRRRRRRSRWSCENKWDKHSQSVSQSWWQLAVVVSTSSKTTRSHIIPSHLIPFIPFLSIPLYLLVCLADSLVCINKLPTLYIFVIVRVFSFPIFCFSAFQFSFVLVVVVVVVFVGCYFCFCYWLTELLVICFVVVQSMLLFLVSTKPTTIFCTQFYWTDYKVVGVSLTDKVIRLYRFWI